MKTWKHIIIVSLVSGLALVTALAQEPAPEGAGEPEKPAPTETSDLSLDACIEKLQENYKKINTYETGFEQELYSLNQGRVISRGEGRVFYKKPAKMVWKYTSPEEHLYLTQGNTIWDYSPKDKEAYVLSVKDALYKSFLLGLGDVKKDFEVSFHSGRKKNYQGLYQIDLVPRDKIERESIGVITLYIEQESFLVQSTEMVDALGNRNRIKFKDMKLNPELEDKLFVFEPPPGTQVIRAEDLVPASP